MSKIFISHSTSDGDLAIKLMDMLQTQFNLTRENFFLTSDEELKYGENWIEEIRTGMQNANIIMPIVTPNFLESQFCLCELGAGWVNQTALVPIIVPPLDHHALDNTPFRSWLQTITLNSLKDLGRLAEAMKDKGVGDVNIVRFQTRTESFYNDVLTPFIKSMEQKESITVEAVIKLKKEKNDYLVAYQEAEEELRKIKEENTALRKMKDASEVKAFDYAQMDEWNTFMEAVEDVQQHLKPLSHYTVSILYHAKKNKYGGFIGEQDDRGKLSALESEGYIVWDDGWVPDYDHPAVSRANKALDKLATVIRKYEDDLQFVERFEEQYKDIRLSLSYSTFWESVLGHSIQHSNH